ncbi:MAG: LPS assembly lipoprotein LptE [Parashewanella sp.]
MLIKRIGFAMMALSILLSAGCGFKLQGSYLIPKALQTVSVNSPDQFSELTRLVRERLRFSNIKIVKNNAKVPQINLISDSLERSALSLYPTGNVAEYELIYHVKFSVSLPSKEAQPFEVLIRRDYLDDPRTASAKSREMQLLVKEMRQQAADKILQNIAALEG